MRLRPLAKIVLALFILCGIAVGLTSINHPIILKWVTGSASHHGRPIPATIYTNGQMNNNIAIFYTDEPDNYLLSLAKDDESGSFLLFNLNLAEKWIGSPAKASKHDYDFIAGHLFQNKASERFIPVNTDVSGATFDPQFSLTEERIKFNMPPGKVEFDSVRIEFN